MSSVNLGKEFPWEDVVSYFKYFCEFSNGHLWSSIRTSSLHLYMQQILPSNLQHEITKDIVSVNGYKLMIDFAGYALNIDEICMARAYCFIG